MRLYLIRHGETVDNVANLYAGSRDSELTNHGVQQASRLGQHFAATAVRFTHIFSSHLKRAVRTAEYIRKAQPEVRNEEDNAIVPLVAHIRELAEQDFGSCEGVSFLARQPGSKASGKAANQTLRKDDPDFVDVESKESMIRRVDVFLDHHLVPIVHATTSTPSVIAIVSHGILLAVLWRRLLQRLPPKSVTVHPEVLVRYNGIDLDRIGAWSNTGYLELNISYQDLTATSTQLQAMSPVPTRSSAGSTIVSGSRAAKVPASTTLGLQSDTPSAAHDGSNLPIHMLTPAPSVSSQDFAGWTVTVCAVNSRQHLVGLKRTGGGVGSARHDEKQKSIDIFFKRRKTE